MEIFWTHTARDDLVRLHEFLASVNPTAAAKVALILASAPEALLLTPGIGQPLSQYAPRDVRRLLVGDYELRYVFAAQRIVLLTIWHPREQR